MRSRGNAVVGESTQLGIIFKLDGILFDPKSVDSVVIKNSAGATLETITSITNPSPGQYLVEAAAVANYGNYTDTWSFVRDDCTPGTQTVVNTFYVSDVSTIPVPYTYCTKEDIEDVYGISNVAKWADMDGDQDSVAMDARILRACEWAYEEINMLLQGGPYSIPFADIPLTIENLAAELAGIWLYEARGIHDYNADTGAVTHRLEYNRKRAYRLIKEIRAGVRKLDLDGTDDIPSLVDSEQPSNLTDNLFLGFEAI